MAIIVVLLVLVYVHTQIPFASCNVVEIFLTLLFPLTIKTFGEKQPPVDSHQRRFKK